MKITKLPLLGIAMMSSFTMISCDSSTPLADTIEENDPTAVSVVAASLRSDDEYAYTPLSGATPLVGVLTADSSALASGIGTPDFVYSQTGTRKFELTASFQAQSNLTSALDTVLFDAGSSGSPIRTLLYNPPSGGFLNADLVTIMGILNAAGAELIINPDNPNELISTNSRTYRHEVTSLNSDFYIGLQSGIYDVIQNSVAISFRAATATELSQMVTAPPATVIPIVSGVETDLQVVESGLYTRTIE